MLRINARSNKMCECCDRDLFYICFCVYCCPCENGCSCEKCCCEKCCEECGSLEIRGECNKKKLFLYFLYLGIIFILSFIFIFNYKIYEEDFEELLYEVEKNLNSKLIYSFKSKPLCDFDEEKLILGSWDGTKIGCFCFGTIFDYECSAELIEQGCKTIPAHNKINYTMINSKYICIKKSPFTYRDLFKTGHIVDKNYDCPNNYKYCGIVDILGRKLCVNNYDPCPINKSTIDNFDSGENIFDIKNILIEIFNENSFNDEEDEILSIFQLNQKIPCINPLEKYWDYHYILEKESQKCETEINNQIFDNRYEILTKYTTKKYDLYLENSIIDKLQYIDDISLNKIKNDEVYLFARRLTGFDKDFIDKFDFKRIKDKIDLSNKCKTNMLWTLIFLGGILVLLIVILFIIICGIKKIDIFNCSSECEGLKDADNIPKKILYIGLIFIVFAFLIIFILICIIFDSYKSIHNIINIKGNDEYLYELFKQEFEKYKINFKFPLAIIILFSLQLFIAIVLYFSC